MMVSQTLWGSSECESIEKSMPVDINKYIVAEWYQQDNVQISNFNSAITKVLQEIPSEYKTYLESKRNQYSSEYFYLLSCHFRRYLRMAPYLDKMNKILYLERGRIFEKSFWNLDQNCHDHSKLILLRLDDNDIYGEKEVLLNDGFVRDFDVHFDAEKILFTWYKNCDNHRFIWEMDLNTRQTRQITSTPVVNGFLAPDYEPCYLPNDDILFTSWRCVQAIPCNNSGYVANFYVCDRDGNYLRRVGFDQDHTNFPAVLPDGRIMYTRWEYNDRNQYFHEGLFAMYADGSHQDMLYGNNSFFPTSIIHARPIPETNKILAICSGHHTEPQGKIAIIDPARGIDSTDGLTLIDYDGDWPPQPQDSWGQSGKTYRYPCPITEEAFLISHRINGTKNDWLYFMNTDGEKELLAWVEGDKVLCTQARLLQPRPRPAAIAPVANYNKTTGTFIMTDLYEGLALDAIPSGTIKKLRIVELRFRATQMGSIRSRSKYAHGDVCTPISTVSGSWDVKAVLGETPVYEDGSAAFTVPARKPVYFQAIDEKGHTVQTMRSWATLMPGETFSCTGCHEDKTKTPTPPSAKLTAMKIGPQPLDDFYGEPRGFSFPKEIQPILDKHCITCHTMTHEKGIDLRGNVSGTPFGKITPSRSYTTLTQPTRDGENIGKYVQWIHNRSKPTRINPYSFGSHTSTLITMLENGHNKVSLSKEEMEKLCCWIDLNVPYAGSYTEGMDQKSRKKYEKYEQIREFYEQIDRQNVESFRMVQTNTLWDQTPTYTQHKAPTSPTQSKRLVTINGNGKANLLNQKIQKAALYDTRGRLIRTIAGEEIAADGISSIGKKHPHGSSGIHILKLSHEDDF